MRWTEDQYQAYLKRMGKAEKEKPVVKSKRLPNKTELEYKALFLAGMDARYEAHTFHMANSHEYTPDWCIYENDKLVAVVECKGGYAFGSQSHSRLAFDQCRCEFQGVKFVWARKGKKGWRQG